MKRDTPAPDPTPEDLRKAERATLILYLAMALLGALPLLALWWSNRAP